MADHVTTAHLAAELETRSHRLVRWLRDQRDGGDPLFAAIPPRSPLRPATPVLTQPGAGFEHRWVLAFSRSGGLPMVVA